MTGGLGPDQIRDLVERFGSLEGALEEARRRPGYAEAINEILYEQNLGYPREPPLPAGELERRLWNLVAAALTEAGEEYPQRGSATYERKAFNEAVRMLRAGEALTEIARQTGIHRNRVARIRDRYVVPRPGGPEYETVAGPDPNTVVLRRRV